MSKFTCELCDETFERINDETCNYFIPEKEILELMPEVKNDPTTLICSNCYELFLEWFKKLTPEERMKIRKDNL